MRRIFIPDALAQEGLEILRRAGGLELDQRSGLKGDALRQALAEADGCVVRSGTTLTADLLLGQRRLKAIVRAGVGVDNIDVSTATREGIVVMNTPGGNTVSTAEHTWALILSMLRHVPAADAKLRAGVWDRKSFVGTQLAGKTIAVVGLGRVGLAVAKRAQAFEMRVIGYDPFLAPARAAELGIEAFGDVQELFPRADLVTVHVPLSDQTRNLVGVKQLAALRKGAFVVNCARGGIVDEAALADALRSGHLGGAALDVFVEEPLKSSPLTSLPNVVLTPHLGASTAEAQVNVSIEAAELLVDYFTTGNVRFSVNMASIEPAELAELRRHFDVAYRLGSLQAQLGKPPFRRVRLEYRGEAAKTKTRLLTAAFAMGMLSAAIEDVNLVNAPLLAAERGIAFEEVTATDAGDFATLIRAEVESEGQTLAAAATTRGRVYNRLVRLGHFRLDAYLEGPMLIFHHQDKPGLIGLVGTVLGRHNVNIAQMTVGRAEQPGGEAIGVLALDQPPPPEAVDELRADGRMTDVRVVRLPELNARLPGL